MEFKKNRNLIYSLFFDIGGYLKILVFKILRIHRFGAKHLGSVVQNTDDVAS